MRVQHLKAKGILRHATVKQIIAPPRDDRRTRAEGIPSCNCNGGHYELKGPSASLTHSASANAAIATIDTLVQRGAVQQTEAQLPKAALNTIGNLEASERSGLSKMVEERGRTTIPTGFGIDPATPLDVLKGALHAVAMGDEKADAAEREKREEEKERAREQREEAREIKRDAREQKREEARQKGERRNFRWTTGVAGVAAVAAIIAAVGPDRAGNFFRALFVFFYPLVTVGWAWLYPYLEAAWIWL